MSDVILASASPRRKELLGKIGMEFEIIPAKGEEIITKKLPTWPPPAFSPLSAWVLSSAW